MSVSLSKGQGVSLKKNEYDLSSVTPLSAEPDAGLDFMTLRS